MRRRVIASRPPKGGCYADDPCHFNYGEFATIKSQAGLNSYRISIKDWVEKWIKQHLRIKQFYGTSENAVKTQIWIAVSVYVLVAIVKKRLNITASLYGMLQILSLTMFEKTSINTLLAAAGAEQSDLDFSNQLNVFN
jgi:hypothetical protein